MPTPRETILQALLAALQTVPDATVLREDVLPERIPAGGLVILRDGDPGAPEVTLSPLAYHYEYRAEIEVIVQGKTPKSGRAPLTPSCRPSVPHLLPTAPSADFATGPKHRPRSRLICRLRAQRRSRRQSSRSFCITPRPTHWADTLS